MPFRNLLDARKLVSFPILLESLVSGPASRSSEPAVISEEDSIPPLKDVSRLVAYRITIPRTERFLAVRRAASGACRSDSQQGLYRRIARLSVPRSNVHELIDRAEPRRRWERTEKDASVFWPKESIGAKLEASNAKLNFHRVTCQV